MLSFESMDAQVRMYVQFVCAACVHVSRSVDSPVRFSDGRSTPLRSLFLAPSFSLYLALVFSPQLSCLSCG